MSIRRSLFGVAWRLADASGLLSVTDRATPAVPRILMYHRVSQSPEWRRTHIGVFEAHLEVLMKHNDVVPIGRVVEQLQNGLPVPRTWVVITFDDGHRDFYEVVLPALSRRQLPATLYVPTAFIDRKEWLWPDRLLSIVLSTRKESLIFGGDKPLSLLTMTDRRAAWNAIADELLTLNSADREAALQQVQRKLDVIISRAPVGEFEAMTWDEVRYASMCGVTIASHSHNHIPLSRETLDEQKRQVALARSRLEEELDGSVEHFAYPHGRDEDFNDDSVRAVEMAGYQSAVTSQVRRSTRPALFSLSRLGPPAGTGDLRRALKGRAYWRIERAMR